MVLANFISNNPLLTVFIPDDSLWTVFSCSTIQIFPHPSTNMELSDLFGSFPFSIFFCLANLVPDGLYSVDFLPNALHFVMNDS